MTTVRNKEIKSLDNYFKLDNTVIYIFDLKHQAPRLINEAKERNIKIYSALARNKTKKKQWIQTFTFGVAAPVVVKIAFSNGCVLLDYSLFDPTDDIEQLNNADEVVKILASYNNPRTGCRVIKNMLTPDIAAIPTHLYDLEDDNYYRLKDAFRGGANNVRIYDQIPYETHVDYHQLYASVMISHNFPYGEPQGAAGYFPHEFGIYVIGGGRARLKKDGYALLSRIDNVEEGMAGADGEWFDLRKTLGCICDPALKLLYENYEIDDMTIDYTRYYPHNFNGKIEFSDAANTIYAGRKNSIGAVKRFYKIRNEYLAGYFERSYPKGSWWKALETPELNIEGEGRKNPIVGRFITAYGRQQLNALLHMFPHDKIAGYDTDCAFFCGKPEEVPAAVIALFGDGIGQLHFDGIYKDVIHKASKHYYGFDLEANAPFKKQSGLSKSGMVWYWNAAKREYELKEDDTDETR